jgi:hypothetical protein
LNPSLFDHDDEMPDAAENVQGDTDLKEHVAHLHVDLEVLWHVGPSDGLSDTLDAEQLE